MQKKGKFIVIEGPDGCGKTSLQFSLAQWLETDFEVLKTREPTHELVGRYIRNIILGMKKQVSEDRIQNLFVADRRQHLKNQIIPALEEGKIVICDRYFFSTIAYGVSSGLTLQWLIKLNSKFLFPDLTLYIRTPPEICINRMNQRKGTTEKFEKIEILEEVVRVYDYLANNFKNFKVIDGNDAPEFVFQQAQLEVIKLFLKVNRRYRRQGV